ncbi:MAG: hypothetical protein Q8O45_05545 [Desulfurivibrionaceae bacterium]|nr:hypothetical protein [Desulfurivibrionaceae bacterium]
MKGHQTDFADQVLFQENETDDEAAQKIGIKKSSGQQVEPPGKGRPAPVSNKKEQKGNEQPGGEPG